MMKRNIVILLFMAAACSGYAQKKDIQAARTYIKSKKDLDKAEQLMLNLLKDSANRDNEKIWLTLYEAQRAIYEQGNEKLYLKQKYDTADLFSATRKLFQTIETFDSIDARPDKNGRVKPKYRKKHAEVLDIIRPNLYNGGVYFVKKQEYRKAYDFFNTYIDCINHPLFAEYDYAQKDRHIAEAAYWTVYCGYKMQDVEATLLNSYLALKDSTHYELLLQYLAETYKLQADTVSYIKTLEDGFEKYPKFPYFFPRLVQSYVDQGQAEKAMKVCDEAIENDSTNRIFRFAKSTLLLNSNHFDECIELCKPLIEEDSTMADAWLNLGLAYFNQAVEIDKNVQNARKRHRQMIDFYRKAKPYLEQYRLLAPDMKEKWALPLYTIYLNLNMGKEFDEVDKLLRKK